MAGGTPFLLLLHIDAQLFHLPRPARLRKRRVDRCERLGRLGEVLPPFRLFKRAPAGAGGGMRHGDGVLRHLDAGRPAERRARDRHFGPLLRRYLCHLLCGDPLHAAQR